MRFISEPYTPSSQSYEYLRTIMLGKSRAFRVELSQSDKMLSKIGYEN
jgi:hypothetical protein